LFAEKLLIFGAGFRCFSVIKGLLLAGIPANRIVLIDTPNFEVEWEAKVGYNITNTVSSALKHYTRLQKNPTEVMTIFNYLL
jgi:hypothetical protein